MSAAGAPRRRVVVTGLGVVTSLGVEVGELWDAIVASRSGIGAIRQFDSRLFPGAIGGEVDLERLGAPALDERACAPYDAARVAANRTLRFGLWAAERAWQAAGLAGGAFDPRRAGVCLGAGVFPVIEDAVAGDLGRLLGPDGRLDHRAYRDVFARRPELLSQQDLGLVAELLSRRFGLRGPSRTVQAACTSGTQALGEALRLVRGGCADVMLSGGADSMMSIFSVAGFTLLGALSRRREPERASRPFDAQRDGFVLGEGAGMLVVEALEHARARGARVLAELAGYGSSADAWRFTDMDPEGAGAAACMRRALDDARLPPEAVDHVNAHGTSTPQNDRMETRALERVFGAHAHRLTVSANKSQLGHLLCAAGGIEAVITVLTLCHQVLPPTLNLEHRDPECDLDYVPGRARPARVDVALSNSFGFGGQNGSLVLRRLDA
jgi:3-oxoacyl-[acyl-carrier-protein] synthase II